MREFIDTLYSTNSDRGDVREAEFEGKISRALVNEVEREIETVRAAQAEMMEGRIPRLIFRPPANNWVPDRVRV